jgi:hypothetical protein
MVFGKSRNYTGLTVTETVTKAVTLLNKILNHKIFYNNA